MRDFIRDAVFFEIVLFLAALSIAWKSSGIIFCASDAFFAPRSLPIPFTVSFIVFLRRKLKTARRAATRFAFLAELVFAILRRYYAENAKKQDVPHGGSH